MLRKLKTAKVGEAKKDTTSTTRALLSNERETYILVKISTTGRDITNIISGAHQTV
jgi:hypothetical protein